MRERSKNAARTRREKENHEFSELARLLPHPSSSTANMDKATVVKLTTAYLKLRNIFPYGIGTPWGSQTQDKFLSDHAAFLVKSLEGFLIIIGPNFKTIYVSEGVSFYLGLSQTEMMGNSIMEYIHLGDHEELKSLLKHEEIVSIEDQIHQEIEVSRCFSLRMKCTLTKRCAGLVRDSYKVILFRGYLKMAPTSVPTHRTNNAEVHYHAVGFVAAGNAVHPTTSLELKMHNNTFMCRTELDLRFLHVEDRIKELTGYDPQHLRHKSLYKFVHVCDSFKLNEDHTQLLSKGQAVSSYYRFLTHNGGWIWIQSSFIMLLNSKSRHSFILSINHALSDIEYKEYLLEEEQLTKPSTFECDESGRPVYMKNSAVSEIPKVTEKTKKKLSTGRRAKNNGSHQFASPAANVQPLGSTASFANGRLPVARAEQENASMVPIIDSRLMNCIQSANSASFARDLRSVNQNLSSHAPVSVNNLQGSWVSGENTNYPSQADSYAQTPVSCIYNTTDCFNTLPMNTNSSYTGSVNDSCYNFSMNPYSNLAYRTVDSVSYSELYPKTAKRICTQIFDAGNSGASKDRPHYVELIPQGSSDQMNLKSIQNNLVTPSPNNCQRNEPHYPYIYNDVTSGSEVQTFYTALRDHNRFRYDYNYGAQIHNFDVSSPPTNVGNSFNRTGRNENSPCCEICCGDQVSNPHLASPLGAETNKTHSNLDETNNIQSGLDFVPENSMDSLEPMQSFAFPHISSNVEVFSNNVNSKQLLQESFIASKSLCSTEETGNQVETVHCDNLSFSEISTRAKTPAQSIELLKASLSANVNGSLHIFNRVSPGTGPLDISENTSRISNSQNYALSPVSANSLSSDSNTDRTHLYLNSLSDYSNGYAEEAEKELAGLNYDVSFNPVTNYRKDFLEFSPFENLNSSTTLYTTL